MDALGNIIYTIDNPKPVNDRVVLYVVSKV